MKRVFADTFYWLAISNPADQWYDLVQISTSALGILQIVTTDEVLMEFLTGMSGLGRHNRLEAVQTVRDVLNDENVRVISQTHQSFLNGVDLYERRADKGYSLKDCISMNTCRQEKLKEVLTNDHHFTQEGFTALISS